MIYTNEPVNTFYVYVSASRATLADIYNMQRTNKLKRDICESEGFYGTLYQTGLTGFYREEGQEVATQERTIKVHCERLEQITHLVALACHDYQQDCVLVVNSQTHTARLASSEGGLLVYTDLNGTFQQVDAPQGECYTMDALGNYYEVI